ncbi:MAG: hypothetical protein ABIJ56_20650 [Pseudomonadota bacterium]
MKFKLMILLTIAAAVFAWGCKVTSSDIEKWKKTQKGPEKLAAVMLDDRYSTQMRAEAAWALAEIEQWDKYDKALKAVDGSARGRIVEVLVPILTDGIREGNAPPSPPIASQVSAKDALFVVLPHASGAEKTKAEEALVEWCVSDFNGRFFAGRYSIEVMLLGIGEPAGTAVAGLLKPEFLAYDKVSEILLKIGSGEARELAGKNIVEIAKARPQGRVEEPLLVAMGRMGGKDVREYLLSLGSSLKVPARVQRGAMMAYLQFDLCSKDDAEALFKLAEDASQDYMARNFAYDAIVCTKEKSFVPRIYKLLHEVGADKDKFRGVGVDEIMKLGGPEAIPGVVEEVASEKDPWEEFEDLRDFVMVRFTQDDKGKPLEGDAKRGTLESLRTLVESKEAVARAIAIFTLGLMGEKSDLDLLKKAMGDGAKLTEWKSKEGEIVGAGGSIQKIEAMNFEKVRDVAGWAAREIEKRQ